MYFDMSTARLETRETGTALKHHKRTYLFKVDELLHKLGRALANHGFWSALHFLGRHRSIQDVVTPKIRVHFLELSMHVSISLRAESRARPGSITRGTQNYGCSL